jgi:hypothetical protein
MGHQILLPALGWHMDQKRNRTQTIGAITCTGAVILMASRSAILCLAIFGALLTLRRGGLFAKTVIWLTAAAILVCIWSYVDPDRASFEDDARQMTAETAWQAVTEGGWQALWGTGLGTIWPWFGPTGRGALENMAFLESPFGPTLFHSHSVLLLLGVEFGLPGILYLLVLLGIILRLFRRSWAGPHGYLMAGIVSTLPLGLTDLTLFKSWEIALIWWLFLFAALRLVGQQDSQAAQRHPAACGGEVVPPWHLKARIAGNVPGDAKVETTRPWR